MPGVTDQVASRGCLLRPLYYITDPERYGVVEFDGDGKVVSIEEKPEKMKSNYAVAGLYFYDNRVLEIAENLTPSARGELEITDVNKRYFEYGELNVLLMGRGYAWLETGTHESLVDATNFVKAIEYRQGLKIACIEEIVYRKGFIGKAQLKSLAQPLAVKDNHSFSSRGVLRGIHFQYAPYEQGKLLHVIKGAVWDVAVDIRPNSSTFTRWFGVELSEENHTMLFIQQPDKRLRVGEIA